MRASLFLLGVATSLAAEPWLLVHKDAPFGLDHAVLGSAFEVRLSFHNKGDATAFDVSFNDAHAWPKDQFEVVSGTLAGSISTIDADSKHVHSFTLKAIAPSSTAARIPSADVEYYATSSGKEESADKIVGKSNLIKSFTMNSFLDSWGSFFLGLFLRYTNNGKIFILLVFVGIVYTVFVPAFASVKDEKASASSNRKKK